MFDLFVPLLICFVFVYGLIKKVDIVDKFVLGAKENIKIAFELLPTLILLMASI